MLNYILQKSINKLCTLNEASVNKKLKSHMNGFLFRNKRHAGVNWTANIKTHPETNPIIEFRNIFNFAIIKRVRKSHIKACLNFISLKVKLI
jgi:hypothetical protein